MDKLRKHLNENPDSTLWEYLQKTTKPIMIYGMGDGAEKIITVLEKKGIEYREIFASDGFVRGHSFRGKLVKSFSQIKEEYSDFIILTAFASKNPETVEMLYSISDEYELYSPDVNVSGDYTEVFDADYYRTHAEQLYNVYEMLEESARQIFCTILDFKVSGKLEYLKKTDNIISDLGVPYKTDGIKTYIDLGAYNGDTLKAAVDNYPNLQKAVAVEPDQKNYRKLCLYADTVKNTEICTYNAAAWNSQCELTLHMGYGKNTTVGNIGQGMQKKKDIIINTVTVDKLTETADLIKYDVEGSEFEAIQGSKNVILNSQPVLIVSVYHNNNDLYRLPELIKSYGEYKLFLNRKPCIPAWELEIVAVSQKHSQ
ncbi:MAG: FkbM family methyltransferase [Clostridia bacterium]|nr:FkbM family methyltransferase [Clostridia bacterium]